MQTKSPKVFISYAWENQAIARQLQQTLQSAGAEVFVDYDRIRAGDNLPVHISKALGWCNTLILLWSQHAANSHWVELEWTGAITSTEPWVKYAPVDVNRPTLAHTLRERAFISQPYFCNLGSYRAGFFKQGFSSPSALFLAISRHGTNEGLVIRLWPEVTWPPLLPLLYRSFNNNERRFDINLRDFEIYSQTRKDYRFNNHQELPELLNATMVGKPNFVLTRAVLWNACGRWNSHPYAEYNPERVIKVGELPSVHIPWNIDLRRSAHADIAGKFSQAKKRLTPPTEQ